jgi:hypothetical protein
MTIRDLLWQTGARPSGRHRFDCPDCGGKSTVAVDETKGVFFCHHANCEFNGGIGTLKKRLGISRQWLPKEEYLRQKRVREYRRLQAETLYETVRSRRLSLLDELNAYNRLEWQAHDAGPGHPATWDALALVYRQQPRIEQELDFLESASAQELIQHFAPRATWKLRALRKLERLAQAG